MEYNPNPTPVAVTPEEQHRKDGITAMVLGIIGLALSWWGVFTVPAFILSIIGFCRAKKNREYARSLTLPEAPQNKAGYICSLIGLIISAAAIFFGIIIVVLLCVFGGYLFQAFGPYIQESIQEYSTLLPAITALV